MCCRCRALCGLRRLCGVACASCSLPQGPRVLNDPFPSGAISVGLIGGTAPCCGGAALLRPAAISLLFKDVLAPLGLICLLNDSPALIGSLVARAVYGFFGGLLDAVFSVLLRRFIRGFAVWLLTLGYLFCLFLGFDNGFARKLLRRSCRPSICVASLLTILFLHPSISPLLSPEYVKGNRRSDCPIISRGFPVFPRV